MSSSDYTPTLVQVGSLLRARTRDDAGNELGTFTPATTPTADEAAAIIQEAVDEMEGRLGPDIPEGLFKAATAVAALLGAMNIESTYYAERIDNAAKSPYLAYERRVNTALDPRSGWLIRAIKDQEAGGEPGPTDDDLEPVFNFDEFAATSGEFIYDHATQRWILRDLPDPFADEGRINQILGLS